MHINETPDTFWTLAEENLLLLAREMEWAEAYRADYPQCSMGQSYLDFLCWELVSAQGEL